MTTQLALAYGLGMLALVNPCGFMMLPAFLAFNLSNSSQPGARLGSRLGRGVGAGLLVSLGFAGTFIGGGLLVAMGLRSITDAVPWFSVVIGAGLVVVGLAMVAGRQFRVQVGRTSLKQASPAGGHLVGFGGAYALAQLGCGMGSLLALIGTGMASESTLGTMGVFGAFALGSTTMLVMLAASTGLMSDVLVRTVRGILPVVNRISGVVLATTGVYLIVYWSPALLGGGSSKTWASRLVHDMSASTRDLVRDNELTLTLIAVVVAGVSLAVVRGARASDGRHGASRGRQDQDALK
ncbi:MAG: cytochrome c biogenesis protein CcdA [Nocardioides sp.]